MDNDNPVYSTSINVITNVINTHVIYSNSSDTNVQSTGTPANYGRPFIPEFEANFGPMTKNF